VNDITGLLEDAAQAYLRSVVPSRIPIKQIYTGLDDENIILPRVVCICQSARAIIQPEGNWEADLQVFVRTNADDTTRVTHRAIASEIFGFFAIGRETISDALSASFTNFAADDVQMQQQGWDRITTDNSRSWRSWMFYLVRCRASD